MDITIDDITFKYVEKINEKDRIFVWLKSKTPSDTEELDFVVYKSNSQGMWRYFTCIQMFGCPYKWEDYTTTTMIDFRLQNFLNNNFDSIPTVSKEVDKFLFSSTSFKYISTFMINHNNPIPEFEVMFNHFGNGTVDKIDMKKLSKIKTNPTEDENYNKVYKVIYKELFSLFTEDELKEETYLLYNLLKKISVFL
jgi:hypothetical protein